MAQGWVGGSFLFGRAFRGGKKQNSSPEQTGAVAFFWFNLASGWDAQAPAVLQVGAVTVIPMRAGVPSPRWSRRSSQGLRYLS